MQQDHRAACLAVLEEIGQFGTFRREMAKSMTPDLHAGSACGGMEAGGAGTGTDERSGR